MEKYREQIINTVMDLVKFKSVAETSDKPGEPFGAECKKALDYILNLRR